MINIFKNAGRPRLRKIRIDPNLKLSDPRPMTVAAIINNSSSKSYDEARFEWELKSVISEDSEGFSNTCDLCGNPHLKTNFIITNPLTEKELYVGSQCIVRFGIVKGNVDIQSGKMIINNFVKLQKHYFEVRSLTQSVMSQYPDAKEYKTFYENLKKILEFKNITNPTIDELGEICFGDRWDNQKQYLFKQDRLWTLWYQPHSVQTIKPKHKKDKVIKEGSTWGHKQRKAQVYNHMAGRSSAFKTDRMSK